MSVVIIFLNADRFLQEAIESVLSQTFTDWELLLVDDGSTDRSTAIARSYALRMPGKIAYLEHDGHVNKGMSASRNLGIAEARGEFVALLDADDVWCREKLKTEVGIMIANPEAAMVAGPALYWYLDGTKQTQSMSLAPGIHEPGALVPRMLQKDDNSPSSVLFRASALRAVGGFESSFKGVFEDQVIHFKMTLSSKVYFHPEPMLLYRQHTDSCCASTSPDAQLAARMVLYARLADFIASSRGRPTRPRLLLEMVRTRIGELQMSAGPRHRQAARALDPSGSVDRQGVGPFLWPVLVLGKVTPRKASALFRKTFDLLVVAYDDGVLGSARTLPGLALSATRSLFPRSMMHSQPTSGNRRGSQS